MNWDIFMDIVSKNLNSTNFWDFYRQLSITGTGTAQWNTVGPLPPETVGVVFYFAYLLESPMDFTSNPVAVLITP